MNPIITTTKFVVKKLKTLLYRVVQNALHVFNRLSVDHECDERTERLIARSTEPR